MNVPDLLPQTLMALGAIFGCGAILVLILGRFNLKRIMEGELGARYLGWLILTPVYIVVLFTNIYIGLLMVAIAMLLCIIEYSRATKLPTNQQAFLYIFVVITLLVVIFRPPLFAALPALVMFLLTAQPILSNRPESLLRAPKIVSWGYMYTTWTLAHGILMLGFPNDTGILIIVIVGCALADIGAYVVGKAIGKTVIAPKINPRKAWEGIIGDLIGATIAVAVFSFAVPEYPLPLLIGLVFIIGIGSSWGDILSSTAKRNADIKDWGAIIPGHGGVIDRLNSLIIVLPLTYYYLVLFAPMPSV
ncbi:MAG: phosphatidate cytidylyltransferase [Chloroflexota bacterium]